MRTFMCVCVCVKRVRVCICMCVYVSIHGRMHDEGTEEETQIAERDRARGGGGIRLSLEK